MTVGILYPYRNMNISIIPPISKACFPLPGSYLTYIIQGKRKLESSQAEHLSRGSHWCQIDLDLSPRFPILATQYNLTEPLFSHLQVEGMDTFQEEGQDEHRVSSI